MSDAESGRIGSLFDDFLKEEGVFEEVQAAALKEVTAWQTEREVNAHLVAGALPLQQECIENDEA